MKTTKKENKIEIRRMKASLSSINKTIKHINKCFKCKKDPGKNFIFIYKKNNELKGKICLSCSQTYSYL